MTLTISPVLKSGLSVAGPRARLGGFPCPWGPHPNPSVGFPVAGTQGSALASLLGGTPEAEYRTPPFAKNDMKLLEARPIPQRGRLTHGPGGKTAIPQLSLTQTPETEA